MAGSTRPRRRGPRIARLAAMLLPLAFLAAALGFGWWMWSDRLASDPLSGVVISVDVSHSDDSVSYTPTFLYSAPWGSGEATTYYGSSFYDYQTGEIVPIFVNPARPDRARVDNDLEFIWLPGGVAAFSLILLTGIAWGMRGRGRPASRRGARGTLGVPKTRRRPQKPKSPPASQPALVPAPSPAPTTKAVRRRASTHTLPARDGPTVRRG